MKPYESKLQYARIQSEVLAIAAGPIELSVDPSFVHSFAGLLFFDDPNLETPVQPSTGSATFLIRSVVQPHVFQIIPSNVIQVSAPAQVDWSSNTEVVQVTPTGIVGATHWQLIWAGNSA